MHPRATPFFTRGPCPPARWALAATGLAFGLVLGLVRPAYSGQVDPTGDILSTYINQATALGDLDVTFIDFLYHGGNQTFTFTSDQAADIGLTAGALYVWGVDRGQGTERFTTPPPGQPSIGAGVTFDAVVILRPDTSVTVVDLISGVATNLGLGAATINGPTISATIAADLLPTFGAGFFSRTEYTANLWPRVGVGNNNQLSDFAPDASNIVVTVVPEPATIVLACVGGPILLILGRRRGRPATGPRRDDL